MSDKVEGLKKELLQSIPSLRSELDVLLHTLSPFADLALLEFLWYPSDRNYCRFTLLRLRNERNRLQLEKIPFGQWPEQLQNESWDLAVVSDLMPGLAPSYAGLGEDFKTRIDSLWRLEERG